MTVSRHGGGDGLLWIKGVKSEHGQTELGYVKRDGEGELERSRDEVDWVRRLAKRVQSRTKEAGN